MSGRMYSLRDDVTTFDPRAPREFWLNGQSASCACPDCAAPMTIRLWLMIADCWQCGCSIELTAAQERQIQSMLNSGDSTPTDQTSLRSPVPSSTTSPPTDRRQSVPTEIPNTDPRPNYDKLGENQPKQIPSTKRAPEAPVRLDSTEQRKSLGNWLSNMPAWLISLLFHMALLSLLALLIFEGDTDIEDFYITLSTEANRSSWLGGETRFDNANDAFQFDMPLPDQDSQSPQQKAAIVKANQDARELRVDPGASLPQLPSLEQVKQTLKHGNKNQRTFAARDPRVRAEMVTKEGGTTLTEAAVARGLRWMAQHQNPDGSWSLHSFNRTKACSKRCRGAGSTHCDSAATSLCLLPFLGAGQTHQVGIYKETVSKGLRWLIQQQKPNGDLRAGVTNNAGMYAHGQGAIVLCEAFALTRDEELRSPAQRAINFIVDAQHEAGGWRYKPGDPGDTSVLGWQLMALQSARTAEIQVPIEAWELASAYLDTVQSDDGSQYAYQPFRRPTHVMTAEGLLCRMYLGWTKDYAPLEQGVRYLLQEHMPSDGTNYYYWYYATQVMHHFGGKRWKAWNLSMRDILVDGQIKKGHEAGSWTPRGGHAERGGRLYSTALAVCTLEVYYRHAPIFRQLDIE